MKTTVLKKLTALFSCVLLLVGCDNNNDINTLNAYPALGVCNFETPQNNQIISNTNDIVISGWAFNKNTNSTSDSIVLYLANEETNKLTAIKTTSGMVREDVAKVFSNNKLTQSGFSATITKGELTAGSYQIVLLQADKSFIMVRCDGEKHNIIIQQ
ncbi:hypothetical protein [Cellvibrio japonicus]|uniref:hypothetical protein n=1 Tax=Cellvibrio japonicus TaxID=155077 RepID=UPI0005A2A09E|nr:hypothetical protein [Cellvibrio japonicus]QEI13686.1 hypothetical protein FY117_16675 [Cellvibrio japonicus]QEI17260.1 hypothetical protein FY116_16680 [Cellvibrio japonicus]QEI20837.1 hypothetical protein FY115_16675 [Cellvibrio japonicus]